MIVCLALSASVDVTYEVPALQLGGISRPTSVTRVAGGKALNVARVAHALGAGVRVVAALGGSSGEWIARELAAEGVDATIIPIAATTRTCTSIVETESASTTSTDIYEPTTPLTVAEWEAVAAATSADPGDWVSVSGSLPSGVDPEALAVFLGSLGAHIIVDSSGEGLRALVGCADVVKVNLHEAEELLGMPLGTAAEACDQLYERYGVQSIVTDGVRGGAALTTEGAIELAVPARLGRFPVGSGDAFLGGLLATLDRGWRVALEAASDAAMRNALVPGPGVLAP